MRQQRMRCGTLRGKKEGIAAPDSPLRAKTSHNCCIWHTASPSLMQVLRRFSVRGSRPPLLQRPMSGLAKALAPWRPDEAYGFLVLAGRPVIVFISRRRTER